MSETTNPPLEPAARGSTPNASPHTSGPIVNPPIEDPRTARTPASDLRNPPLIGGSGADTTSNPALASDPNRTDAGGLNPPPDDADIERWFEEQLNQATPTVPPAKKRAAQRTAAKKRPTKQPSTSKKPTKKKATRRRTTSSK